MKNKVSSFIKEDELNMETYPIYCNLYLVQRIYEVLPSSFGLDYGDISIILNLVDNSLYDNLCNESVKILLLNQIYSIFMQNGIELDREFLHELVSHLSYLYPKYDYNMNSYDRKWNEYKESDYYKELIQKEEDEYEFCKNYF